MLISSIILHPDWIMRRYAGWKTVYEDENCLVLGKGHFPLRRICVLSSVSSSNLFARIKLARFRSWTTIFSLKFIPSDDAAISPARSQGLTLTPDSQRMFHKFTFIIDLTSTIDQLWMAMRPTNRNLCNKANQSGVQVRVENAPSAFDVDQFISLYSEMARTRGLAIPQRSVLMKMFADGRLILGCAERDGVVLSMALCYLAGETAMYLYGVSSSRSVDGAGQLLQWEMMQALKAHGTTKYDLGGVPRVEESDGIFKFKKGFGGLGIELGPEFYWLPVWVQIFRRLRQWLQRRNSPV